jgi:hypothetical protein
LQHAAQNKKEKHEAKHGDVKYLPNKQSGFVSNII